MKRRVLIFLAIMTFTWTQLPLSAAQPTAKEILERTLEQQKTMTFHAVMGSGNATVQSISQLKNPDGTVYRKCVTEGHGNTSITIKNKDGEFQIFGDGKTAIKVDFHTDDKRPNYEQFATYSVTDGFYGKSPCYIVTVTFEKSPEAFAHFDRSIPSDLKKEMSEAQWKKMFDQTFIGKTVYEIGKDNLFIFSKKNYTSDGKLKLRSQCKEVNFYPTFSEDTFNLPNGVRIEYARNVSTLLEKNQQQVTTYGMEKAMKAHEERKAKSRPAAPSIWIQMGNWADTNFNRIISVMIYVPGVGGVCTLGLVAAVKLVRKVKK